MPKYLIGVRNKDADVMDRNYVSDEMIIEADNVVFATNLWFAERQENQLHPDDVFVIWTLLEGDNS